MFDLWTVWLQFEDTPILFRCSFFQRLTTFGKEVRKKQDKVDVNVTQLGTLGCKRTLFTNKHIKTRHFTK